MNFRCPNCGNPCTLRQGACQCGFSLTLGSVVRHYFSGVQASVKATTIRCPTCNAPVALNESACPNNHPVSMSATVGKVVNTPRKSFLRFCLSASPRTKRVIQWIHLLLSAVLLFWLLGIIEERYHKDWILKTVLSSFYATLLVVILRAIIPKQVFRAIAAYAPWRVKLALIFHAFSVMILLHLLVSEWWMRAAVFATIVGVSLASAFVFYRFGSRFASGLMEAFCGPANRPFEPTAPQGRNVRVD